MAKAASPVRLQEDLMQAATTAGERLHRSAAQQIEYWASIGRSVSNVLTPDSLLAVSAGLVRLKVEPVIAPTLDPDQVFDALERDRDAGTLATSVTTSSLRYQPSLVHPGQLEQLHSDGLVVTGQFNNGVFTPMAE